MARTLPLEANEKIRSQESEDRSQEVGSRSPAEIRIAATINATMSFSDYDTVSMARRYLQIPPFGAR
jgi:hypothetical protein